VERSRKPVDERRPVTIIDVAQAARVSKSTVSNVLHGRPVSAPLRGRVEAAIEELGYLPSAVAQGLARQSTRTIGVLVPRLDNPFYGDILGGIEQSAEERGYRLLIASTDVLGRTELQAVESLIHHRPAGYILCGPRDEAVATRLTARGLPVMVVDSHLAPPQAARIVIDDYVGMQLAVRHLVGLGHRRIAAVIDSEVDPGRHRRLAGYVHALSVAGLPHDDALRVPDMPSPGSREPAPRPAVVDRLLELADRPTAVVAGDDLSAVGLIDSLEARGIRVPADMSVIGFDDIAWARVGRIALTTVRQPARVMGQTATVALIDHLRGDESVPLSSFRHLVEPELVIRQTTGPAP
jgi:LacI family transcriptional regulator